MKERLRDNYYANDCDWKTSKDNGNTLHFGFVHRRCLNSEKGPALMPSDEAVLRLDAKRHSRLFWPNHSDLSKSVNNYSRVVFFILVRFSNGIHAIQWLQFFLEYFKGPILSHAHTKCCVNIPQGSIYDLLVIYVCSVLTYSRPFCLVAGFFSKGPPFDFESETFCFGITSLVWGADIGIAPYTCPVSCNGSRKHQTFSGGSSSPWSIVNVCGSMPCQSTWASQFWFVPRLVKLKRPKENTGTQSTRSTMWVVN